MAMEPRVIQTASIRALRKEIICFSFWYALIFDLTLSFSWISLTQPCDSTRLILFNNVVSIGNKVRIGLPDDLQAIPCLAQLIDIGPYLRLRAEGGLIPRTYFTKKD